MATRTDVYNLAADVALETAIGTLMSLEANEGAEKHRAITRKEALRFLHKRITWKDTNDRVRPRAAKTPGVSQ